MSIGFIPITELKKIRVLGYYRVLEAAPWLRWSFWERRLGKSTEIDGGLLEVGFANEVVNGDDFEEVLVLVHEFLECGGLWIWRLRTGMRWFWTLKKRWRWV
ncbi:hypothetical protein LOK49_LG03G03049 [Camellia lanceoleosa]|uniref:Uncharacterized protein n=1 Tax=Camellia lanceoleosa TaxID=1840588 RepID=A0ACC0IGR4_9ERIC|nr:hypothetical protein LOK49_LG03G03049 [Camellia lanceoleosa]